MIDKIQSIKQKLNDNENLKRNIDENDLNGILKTVEKIENLIKFNNNNIPNIFQIRIQNHINLLYSEFVNFTRTPNKNQLANFIKKLEDTLVYTYFYKIYEEDINKEIKKNIIASNEKINTIENLWNEKINLFESELKSYNEKLESIKSHENVLLTKIEKYENQTELNYQKAVDYFTQREKTLNASVSEYKTKLESKNIEILNEIKENLVEYGINYTKEMEEIKGNAVKYENQLKELVNVIGTNATTSHYKESAELEKFNYFIWRVLAIVFGVISIGYLITVVILSFIDLIQLDSFYTSISNLIVITGLGSLSGVTIKFASDHRKQYLKYNKLALEFATKDIFLNSFGDEAANRVKEKMMDKYFTGNNEKESLEIESMLKDNPSLINHFFQYMLEKYSK